MEKCVTFAKVLRWGFVVVVATTAVIILLILSGVFDPKPIGALVGERPLFPQIIAPEAPRLTWLEETVPTGSYTVRLTAAQEEGRGMDIGYGLVLGDDDTHLAMAVSPLGYVSVWQQTGDEVDVIFPWQPWPHVGRDSAPNEIWVDVEDGHLNIRINREFLWEGEIVRPFGQIGVIGESFGETAVVNFQMVQIFEE